MSQPGSASELSAGEGGVRHETVMDVGTERISRVYAEALLRAAEHRNQADEVLEDLQQLLDKVFAAEPRFEAFLTSGSVDRKRKTDLVESIFGNRASELLVNALLVLNNHDRLNLLRPVIQEYRRLRDTRAGRIRVEVRTAVALPADQQDRLVQELRATFDKEPVLEIKIDPELLGGMVVQVGDWLYDHSVRTQIANIRNQIMARSSYEIQSRRDSFCTANGN